MVRTLHTVHLAGPMHSFESGRELPWSSLIGVVIIRLSYVASGPFWGYR